MINRPATIDQEAGEVQPRVLERSAEPLDRRQGQEPCDEEGGPHERVEHAVDREALVVAVDQPSPSDGYRSSPACSSAWSGPNVLADEQAPRRRRSGDSRRTGVPSSSGRRRVA